MAIVLQYKLECLFILTIVRFKFQYIVTIFSFLFASYPTPPYVVKAYRWERPSFRFLLPVEKSIQNHTFLGKLL